MDALATVVDNQRYHFEQGDIADATTLRQPFFNAIN
ncbi:RffG, partial [Pasteurella multocida subsp. multocida str. Anand1_cattle]